MKILRMAVSTAAVLIAAAAFASPIFGTWTGEMNGKPISLTFTHSENRARGNLVFAGMNAAQPLPISDFHMVRKAESGLYPFTMAFRAADSAGKSVRYEIEQTSPTEATLRNIDEPSAPPVKLQKQK